MKTYEVDIGDKTYEVDAPDEATAWKWANATHGKKLNFQGMQREALARGGPQLSPAEQVANDPISREASAIANATPAEVIAGNPVTRWAMGAARPLLGAAQFAANNLEKKDESNSYFRDLPNRLQSVIDKGRVAYGSDGHDWATTAGEVMSPVVLGAAKIAPASTALGRINQGAIIGGTMGATAPVVGDDYERQNRGNILAGTLLGGTLNAGIEGVKAVAPVVKHAFEPVTQKGREAILNRYQQGLAGGKSEEMAKLLREAPELVPGSAPTAGEALASMPESTAMAAHQKAIAGNQAVSPQFAAREATQRGARASMINEGGGTEKALTDALVAREANAKQGYGPIMAKQINPQSDEQLMQEAIQGRFASRASALQDQGRFATAAAQQENLAHGGGVNLRGSGQTMNEPYISVGSGGGRSLSPSAYPVPGYPRIPGRYTHNIDRAKEAGIAAEEMGGIIQQRVKEEGFLNGVLESLRNTVGMGNKSLDNFTSRPSFQSALAEAEISAREAGRPFPSKPTDRFTVEDMQAVKELLDENIKKKVGLGLSESDRSVRDIASTRDQFVKWLSEKVPEWKDARLQYSEDSVPINRMQVMRELGTRLTDATGKETPAAFMRAVDDRTPEAAARLLKKSTGFTRYKGLAEAIGPKNAEAVQSVTDDLNRTLQFQRNASGTNIAGASSIAQKSEGQLPRMLSTPATVANWVMKKMGEGADEKIVKMAAERYLNPKMLADALEAGKNPSSAKAKGLAQKIIDSAMGESVSPQQIRNMAIGEAAYQIGAR